jgi:hypothetical protein
LRVASERLYRQATFPLPSFSHHQEQMSEPLPPDVRAALPTNPQAQPALPSQLPAEAIAALQQGNKIDAIRIVRAELGIGLKEAKDLVDAAEAGGNRGTESPKNSLPPGVVQTTRIGMAVLTLAIALGTAAVWWIITRP